MYDIEQLRYNDKSVYDAIISEKERQHKHIELIASENFVSESVMAAQGSVMTNKYAEGYANKRYYGGCSEVDKVELIAIERLKQLFGCEHANVQPHSGSSANIAIFNAFLKPNDTVLGMNLSHGGHLTHGNPVNFSGLMYNFVAYGVSEDTETINYDEVRKVALETNPKMIIAGASAYSREIDFSKFREIADEVGAILFVDMAHIAGLVASGLHMSPIPYADVVSSTTHKTLRGPRGGIIMCKEEHAKKIDKSIFPGTQGGPLMHVIAAKAVAFGEALTPEFKQYSKKVIENAKALGKALQDEGIEIVSGGTDNHLLLIKLNELTGKEVEKMLDEVKITVNKNTIPFETRSPLITSGIRIGTPAVTTRGMGTEDMKIIAKLIALTVKDFNNQKEYILEEVEKLTEKYPLYK